MILPRGSEGGRATGGWDGAGNQLRVIGLSPGLHGDGEVLLS